MNVEAPISVTPGATATDNCDKQLLGVSVDYSELDLTSPGSYKVYYDISDSQGNPAQTVSRSVNVVDTTPPVIALLGESVLIHAMGAAYADPGAIATDSCGVALPEVSIDDTAGRYQYGGGLPRLL